MTHSKSGKGKKRAGKKASRPRPLPKLDFASRKRITNPNRALVAICALIMGRTYTYENEISLDDLMQSIINQAEQNNEVLGKRTKEYVEVALDRLSRSRYIILVPCADDDDRVFKVHPDFQNVVAILAGQIEDAEFDLSFSDLIFDEYRAICNFFNQLITSKKLPLDKTSTRRELLRELWDYRAMSDARATQGSTYSGVAQLSNDCDDDIFGGDDMEVDDVPQASTSSALFQTPIRKSPTVNQIDAYPTPESLPRPAQISQQISPPYTPTCERSASQVLINNSLDENENMEEEMEAGPSSSTTPTASNAIASKDEGNQLRSELLRTRWRLGIHCAQKDAMLQKVLQRENLRVGTLMRFCRAAVDHILFLRRATNSR